MKLSLVVFAVVLSVMPSLAACQAQSGSGLVMRPPTPAAVKGIVVARRFTLSTPYRSTWAKTPYDVSRGTLVVIEVDPAYVVPRDALEPVLYAGDVAVERLNHGHVSGHVIGIVPGDVDPATVPIWFGRPQLPERLTPDMIAEERARAEKAGIRALPQARSAANAAPASATDLAALLRDVAAALVYRYAPEDKRIADAWRLPVAKPRAQRGRD